MIEGLLRHGTDAEIEANYTDTHGASLVGFAFTELLGFKLLPRLRTSARSSSTPPAPTWPHGPSWRRSSRKGPSTGS
jgi:TnpA family transposase